MTSYYEKNTSYYLSIFNNDLQVVEQCISFIYIFSPGGRNYIFPDICIYTEYIYRCVTDYHWVNLRVSSGCDTQASEKAE